MRRTPVALAALVALDVLQCMVAHAQESTQVETDPLVVKKLEWFRDQKFGLLMHWGPYSQWGVVESWSLCPEDEPWCVRRGEHAAKTLRQRLWDTNKED